MAPTQSNPSSDAGDIQPAKKRKGRSNPLFALYVPSDCVEPLHGLIVALAATPAARDEHNAQPVRIAKGAKRQFIERVLSRVAILKSEHLAAMPITDRTRSLNTQRLAFSVGQKELDAASAQAKALGVSLQDAARAIALSLIRRAQPQAAASVNAFLRTHTHLATDGANSNANLARKLVRCEPALREQFGRVCESVGIQPKAAYALAIQRALDASTDRQSARRTPVAGDAAGIHLPRSGRDCWNVYATRSALDAAQAAANHQGLSCGQWLRSALNDWTRSASTVQPSTAQPSGPQPTKATPKGGGPLAALAVQRDGPAGRAAPTTKAAAVALAGISFRPANPALMRGSAPTTAVEPIAAPTRARAGGGRFMEELSEEEAWGESDKWAGSTNWAR